MGEKLRKSGIDIIGDVPWGTHFCQFYQTKEDLMDILVPYFKAGLENNEFCIWITAQALEVEEAKETLKKAVPDFDVYLESRQIEIVPYTHWYVNEDVFNSERALKDFVEKTNQALASGYDGLRLSVNTFSLEETDWDYFVDYEEEVDNIIGKHNMIALCTYSLDKCSAIGIIDTVSSHQFALAKKEGKWGRIENFGKKKAEEVAIRATQNSEVKLKEANDYLVELVEEKTALLRKAYELLKETEKDLDEVQEIAHIGNWKWNILTNELCWSDEIYRIFGLTPQIFDATFDAYFNYVHPDDRNIVVNAIKKAFKGEPYSIDNRIITANGEERIVHTDAEFTFNEDNIPVHARGIVQDITEHKKVEAKLKDTLDNLDKLVKERTTELERAYKSLDESKKGLSEAQRTSHTGSWDLNIATEESKWSDEMFRIFGFDPQEFGPTDEMFLRYVHPEDREYVNNAVKKALKGKPYSIDYRIILANGEESVVHEQREITFDKENIPVRITGTIQDIAERKKIEKVLKLASGYNRCLIDASLDPLFITNPDGKITDVNKAAEKATGYLREELIGTDFINYFTDPEQSRKDYQQALRKRSVLNWELEIKHKDGQTTPVLYNSSVRMNESGEIIGAVASAHDITERKKTEEALKKVHDSLEEKVKERTSELEEAYESLKESEKSLAEAQKMAHVGNWEWDIATDKSYWSDELYRIYGRNRQEPGATYYELLSYVHPDDRDYMDDAHKKTLNGKPYSIDHRIILDNGEERTVHIQSEVIFDEKNIQIQLKGIVQDITERKRAEETLRESEARLRRFYESGMFGLFYFNLGGSITDANDKFLEIVGYTREDLQAGQVNWDKMTPPEYRLLDEHCITELKSKSVGTPYEKEYIRKDGSRVPIILGAATFNEAQDEGVAVVIDITERKKADERIKILASAVESSNDAIATESLEGIITSWNRAAEQIYGYSAEEIIGKNASIVEQDNIKGEIRQLIEKIKQGKKVKNYETLRLKKDGTLINVSVTLSPIFNASGELVAISAIARDITCLLYTSPSPRDGLLSRMPS